MRIAVKTLKNTSFYIEVKASYTIADVKSTIEESQGSDIFPAVYQMLVYDGKILEDGANFIDEYQDSDDSDLVLMSTKGRFLKPAGIPPSTTPPPTSTTEAESAVDGCEETIIRRVLDIGGGRWDRKTVTGRLRDLKDDPRFKAWKVIIQTMIQDHPDGLLELLEVLENHSDLNLQSFLQVCDDEFSASLIKDVQISEKESPAREQVVNVSEEDVAAIERLIAMGFEPDSVLQVYLECGRNEELAAALLLCDLHKD